MLPRYLLGHRAARGGTHMPFLILNSACTCNDIKTPQVLVSRERELLTWVDLTLSPTLIYRATVASSSVFPRVQEISMTDFSWYTLLEAKLLWVPKVVGFTKENVAADVACGTIATAKNNLKNEQCIVLTTSRRRRLPIVYFSPN